MLVAIKQQLSNGKSLSKTVVPLGTSSPAELFLFFFYVDKMCERFPYPVSRVTPIVQNPGSFGQERFMLQNVSLCYCVSSLKCSCFVT